MLVCAGRKVASRRARVGQVRCCCAVRPRALSILCAVQSPAPATAALDDVFDLENDVLGLRNSGEVSIDRLLVVIGSLREQLMASEERCAAAEAENTALRANEHAR